MHKIHNEQNSNILNKDRIQPCICTTLSHLPHPNPIPGSNKTLFKKTGSWPVGQTLLI